VYFLQITQAPITVTIQDPEHPEKSEILTIPKFPLSQITEWAAEIAEAYENKATDGLDDIRKREYLTMYPTIPPSIEEMKRHLRTPPGIRRVLDYCIPKAAVAGTRWRVRLRCLIIWLIEHHMLLHFFTGFTARKWNARISSTG
jgi:hypothetical protein